MVGLAVLCAAAAAASLLLESQGLEQALRDARGQAVAYVDDVITPVVARRSAFRAFSVSESEDLRARIDEGIHDPDVTRVRLWSTGGSLLFSTDDRDGLREPAPAEVRRAARGDGSVRSSVDPGRANGGSPTSFRSFVPVPAGSDPSVAVAQVDQRYRPIEAEVKDTWRTVRTGAGGGAALFLALFLLSLARRTRPGHAGSAGFERPRTERPKVEPPPEVQALEKRLEKTEDARGALEEQLEQLRTQVAGTAARAVEQEQVFEAQLARSK